MKKIIIGLISFLSLMFFVQIPIAAQKSAEKKFAGLIKTYESKPDYENAKITADLLSGCNGFEITVSWIFEVDTYDEKGDKYTIQSRICKPPNVKKNIVFIEKYIWENPYKNIKK